MQQHEKKTDPFRIFFAENQLRNGVNGSTPPPVSVMPPGGGHRQYNKAESQTTLTSAASSAAANGQQNRHLPGGGGGGVSVSRGTSQVDKNKSASSPLQFLSLALFIPPLHLDGIPRSLHLLPRIKRDQVTQPTTLHTHYPTSSLCICNDILKDMF